MSRLKDQYLNEIVDALMKKFGYKNKMQVPKLDKIVVNMGVGEGQCQDSGFRSKRSGDHQRPEGCDYQGKEVCGKLQDQRRYGNRLQGNVKRRKNV